MQKHSVASGDSYVGKGEAKILQAFLGTCVGVALYDSAAGAGGIIHLLLPEPPSGDGVIEPEKYASTGLPMFIEAVSKQTASREHLKAIIAGGALVGPVSGLDLRLDLGGRTVEVVSQILDEEGIEIERSETGGFFTCCMSMNMKNMEISIEPVGRDRLMGHNEMNVPSLEAIARATDSIQPIPQVVMKILRMVNQGTYSVEKIADEVRKDQVIAARTLRLCNSALFPKKNKIDSLDHALIFLGRDLFMKSVVTSSFKTFFEQFNKGYSLCKGGIYHHAVGVAAIAEKLASSTKKALPGVAYTAGIVHDIGKVVIDQYVASAYPYFYRDFQDHKTFLEIERELLEIDHTEVGSTLAEKWSFPDSLINTTLHHHYPERCTENQELVHIIYLADLLMSRFNTGLEMERMNTDTLVLRLDKIGLSPSDFPEIIDSIPREAFGPAPELAMNA